MLQAKIIAQSGKSLDKDQVCKTLSEALEGKFSSQRVLVLIPDHTRSLPLPFLFRTLVKILCDVKTLDFMVALGTHPPLSEKNLNRLVGINNRERSNSYSTVGIRNHAWDDPTALVKLGTLSKDEIRALAGEFWHDSLPDEVDVRLNKAVFEYDHILILGPTFPHEVVGFSGGAKYLFPGISGAEMISATHWLGALAGVVNTIGVKETPVRAMIHEATRMLSTPVTLLALVVDGYDITGLFIGDHISAWTAAANFSAQRHIRWVDKPFQRVLSCAPPMYDELWTAAKAMYKLEPAIALDGELVIYAPHLDVVSHVHGEHIYEVGYHILPYFLSNWESFKHVPLGVLAHSTHLRGSGEYRNNLEKPNVRVTLASKISPEDCSRLNLSYFNPAQINIDEWKNREDEGILFVPKAGEVLYKLIV